MHSCAHVKTYMMLYHLHLYFTGRQCITNGDEICRKLTSATTVYKIRAYIHEYVLYVYHKCTKCYCENVVSAFCKTFSLDFGMAKRVNGKNPRENTINFTPLNEVSVCPEIHIHSLKETSHHVDSFSGTFSFSPLFFSKSQRCLLLSCF